MSDTNKVSDVKKFVEENGYKEGIEDKELFVFGSKVGNGTESDHFQVGFTSVILISRIPTGVVFHCDGTYKIVKVGYLFIVFGVSDINRKFYPIAFMFTSHEQNADYLRFFKCLKKLTVILNLFFDPKYCVIDASKAMAHAINRMFPLCCIIMCWFHLKYNVC